MSNFIQNQSTKRLVWQADKKYEVLTLNKNRITTQTSLAQIHIT